MGIKITHGSGIGLDMAKAAGEAQGRAMIAQAEAENDRLTRQTILAGLSIGAQAARQRIDILASESEAAKNRDFTAKRDAENRDFARERDQTEMGFRADQNELDRNAAESRFARNLDFDKSRAAEDDKRMGLESASRIAENRAQESHYRARQTQEEDAIRVRAEETKRTLDFRRQLMEGVASDYESRGIEPDATYFAAMAEIAEKGTLTEGTRKALPSGQGNAYSSRPAGESDMQAIAMAMPKKAIEIAMATDDGGNPSATPRPTKEAVGMLGALSNMAYSPRFDRRANPATYFQDLESTVKAYREMLPPGPQADTPQTALIRQALMPMEKRLAETKVERATYLLPRIVRDAQTALASKAESSQGKGMATRGWWEAEGAREIQNRLDAFGVSDQEYQEYASAQLSARTLFQLERQQAGKSKPGASTPRQPDPSGQGPGVPIR